MLAIGLGVNQRSRHLAVHMTRDDGETDREHYLVAEMNVSCSQTNSYGAAASTYTKTETVAPAPEHEFAGFIKSGTIDASTAG